MAARRLTSDDEAHSKVVHRAVALSTPLKQNSGAVQRSAGEDIRIQANSLCGRGVNDTGNAGIIRQARQYHRTIFPLYRHTYGGLSRMIQW